MLSLPAAISAKAVRISESRRAGKSASMTHWRICAPVLVRALMSSTSSASSAAWIRSLRPLCSRKSRYACAVVAKPPGTDTPAPARLLIISPRDAFLPPTCSTSWTPSLSRETTYSTTFDSPVIVAGTGASSGFLKVIQAVAPVPSAAEWQGAKLYASSSGPGR
ncbi:hypothetical protein D3C76_1042700 [compost metagenome]